MFGQLLEAGSPFAARGGATIHDAAHQVFNVPWLS
jgi:hypothetical protein